MTRTPRVIDLAGAPREVGRAHGQALADEIRRVVEVYRAVLGRSDQDVRAAADGLAATTAAFAPAVAEEIGGIAEGAGIEPWWVHVLNGRSELMADARDGCTALFVPDLGLLGQTWDWIDALEPLVAVLRVVPEHGPAFVTVTEPGLVAKIGLNATGLGVALTFLYAPGPHRGVPVHVLLRHLLGCASLADARAEILRAGTGRAANVVVGTASEGGLDASFTGDDAQLTPLDRPFAHTNHIEGNAAPADPFEANSRARLATARRLVGSVASVDDLIAALDDRSDTDHPICAPYAPYRGARVGTTATVAMDLAARHLSVRLGPRPGTDLHPVTVPPQEPS